MLALQPIGRVDGASAVWCVACASDDTVLTGRADGVVQLWRISKNDATSLDENQDGEANGTVSKDNSKGTLVLETEWQTDHTLGVTSVDVSADGQKLVSSSIDGSLCIRHALHSDEVQDGNERDFKSAFVTTTLCNAYRVSLSPDGQLVAGGGSTGKISIWESAGGLHKRTFGVGGERDGAEKDAASRVDLRMVMALQYSEDGRRLAAASSDGMVRVLDVETGKTQTSGRVHGLSARSLAWCNAEQIVTGGDDNLVSVFDARTPTEGARWKAHDGFVMGVSSAHDGALLASCSEDGSVKLWDARASGADGMYACATSLNSHSQPAWGVAFVNHFSKLISVGDNQAIILYDVAPPGTTRV
ncbi:WD repeat-containing protein 61 [Porphyridium purpureum]|uniref:WD repeat-containing protein 61 n=1 Tax=Porphyridium purpureum TaxID=35688 RepID=A0A5J4Z6L9_PORPP|nr:WD repeat-containing protein 61 [Porphyridium purpureum]|eukprot:POR4176..scf295_1